MYQVFIAEPKDPNLEKGLLKHFIKSYLTQEELDFLHKILTNLPNIRPFGAIPVTNISSLIMFTSCMKFPKVKRKSFYLAPNLIINGKLLILRIRKPSKNQ